MRIRQSLMTCALTSALVASAAIATPALAHGDRHHHEMDDPDGPPPPPRDMRPEWRGGPPWAGAYGLPPEARERWLDECRHRAGYRDDGVGGALIGGAAGGVIGNRVAGRGHRVVGTVAGAAVGAVAGAAIDRAEDRGRTRDDCEAYLDDYYAYYAQPGPGHGYPGYTYAQPMQGCCTPPPAQPKCVETVTYEYEYVPAPRRRVIHRAPKRIPDKRIRVAPDKRVSGS